MRLFQPTFKHRATGTRKHSRRWWVHTIDPHAAEMYLPGFHDKARTMALGHNVERLIAARLSGSELDADLQRFCDTLGLPMLSKVRAKLVERGVLGRGADPLHRHLLAYLRHLQGKGTTGKHSRLTLARAIRVLREAKVLAWADLTAEKVRTVLQSRRTNASKSMSTTTANHHARAIKMLARWMHKSGRAGSDVLLSLSMFKALPGEQSRCERRALTPDEARTLLETTHGAAQHHGMTGAERSLLYRLAIETGLRASELASLTRSSFDLRSQSPMVRLPAGDTKNRRAAEIELRGATAALLAEHVTAKLPGAKAFNLPDITHMAHMLRADLEAAGIAYIDDAGRKVDFHALRHTRGVWLAQHHDAKPAEIRELMRVSSMALVDRYSRSLRVTRSIAESGPDMDAPSERQRQQARATGTTDTLATVTQTSKKLSALLSVGACISVDKPGQSAVDAMNVTAAGDDDNTLIFSGNSANFAREGMPAEGLEPTLPLEGKRILNPSRLPIPPRRRA
jgi:integrase